MPAPLSLDVRLTMDMKTLFIITLHIFILCSPVSVQSAEIESERDLGISLSLGLGPGGEDKGHYLNAPNTTINTTIAFGLGLHYRSISLFHATRLNISAEAYYHSHDTDPVPLTYEDATVRYTGYSVPVLMWLELMPNSSFGPFVRIGMGAIWTDWTDECSDDRLFSPNHKFWSFAIGMGGGIYYSLSDRFDAIFIAQGTIATDESVVSEEGWRDDTLYAPWQLGYIGVTIRYWY